jgi:hypothetical protein
MPEAIACRFNTTSLSVTNAYQLDTKYPIWTAILAGGLTVHQRQNGIFCRVVWLSSGNAW